MLATTAPYQQYFDTDGAPLDAGFVYFGTPDLNPETNPITVYWDSAGTQPAAQPVRTLNGYAVRNGTPTAIYADTDYSQTVKNQLGTLVVYSPRPSSAYNLGYNILNVYPAGTIGAKLKESISVKDFGAYGDDVHDDTIAIQAAVTYVQNQGGGEIFFPHGTYKITSAIAITGNTVSMRGGTRFTTLIKQYTLNAEVLTVTGGYFTFRSMGISYSGTPTAGANAIHLSTSSAIYAGLFDFVVRSSWIAVLVDGNSASHKITDFDLFDYGSCGILLSSGALDIFVHNFTMNAGSTTRGLSGGIRLQDFCEAVLISSGDILLGKYSLTIDASAYVAGSRPAYNRFSNVYFDSSSDGSVINNTVLTKFEGCWFSGGRTNVTPGLTISQSDDLVFTDTDFFNCGSHGCQVNALAVHTRFLNGCTFDSNSATAGAGVAHGLIFASNTGNFVVQGVKARNGLYTGQQGYGILVGAGTSVNYTIADNDLTNNLTGSLSDGGSGSVKTIRNNLGYASKTKGTAAIGVGAAVINVTHGLPVTPVATDINVSFTSQPNASAVQAFYITGITSTIFQIATNANVAVATINFAWTATVPGGG